MITRNICEELAELDSKIIISLEAEKSCCDHGHQYLHADCLDMYPEVRGVGGPYHALLQSTSTES